MSGTHSGTIPVISCPLKVNPPAGTCLSDTVGPCHVVLELEVSRLPAGTRLSGTLSHVLSVITGGTRFSGTLSHVLSVITGGTRFSDTTPVTVGPCANRHVLSVRGKPYCWHMSVRYSLRFYRTMCHQSCPAGYYCWHTVVRNHVLLLAVNCPVGLFYQVL